MGLFDEEEKRDQGPISSAIFVGFPIFLISWYLRSLSVASAIGAAVALITWGVSTYLQNYEPRMTYLGATSSAASFRASESNSEFFEKKFIPLVVRVAAAWGVWRFLGGVYLALMVGGVVGWRIWKRVEEERERKRKKRLENQISTALMFGAGLVGLAGLTAGVMRRRR